MDQARDKSFGLDPSIRFYDLEDGYETEKEEEEAEILIVYDSSLAASKQTSSRGSFHISTRSIMRDPCLLTQCMI